MPTDKLDSAKRRRQQGRPADGRNTGVRSATYRKIEAAAKRCSRRKY